MLPVNASSENFSRLDADIALFKEGKLDQWRTEDYEYNRETILRLTEDFQQAEAENNELQLRVQALESKLSLTRQKLKDNKSRNRRQRQNQSQPLDRLMALLDGRDTHVRFLAQQVNHATPTQTLNLAFSYMEEQVFGTDRIFV